MVAESLARQSAGGAGAEAVTAEGVGIPLAAGIMDGAGAGCGNNPMERRCSSLGSCGRARMSSSDSMDLRLYFLVSPASLPNFLLHIGWHLYAFIPRCIPFGVGVPFRSGSDSCSYFCGVKTFPFFGDRQFRPGFGRAAVPLLRYGHSLTT